MTFGLAAVVFYRLTKRQSGNLGQFFWPLVRVHYAIFRAVIAAVVVWLIIKLAEAPAALCISFHDGNAGTVFSVVTFREMEPHSQAIPISSYLSRIYDRISCFYLVEIGTKCAITT